MDYSKRPCPCSKCNGVKWVSEKTVHIHIKNNGTSGDRSLDSDPNVDLLRCVLQKIGQSGSEEGSTRAEGPSNSARCNIDVNTPSKLTEAQTRRKDAASTLQGSANKGIFHVLQNEDDYRHQPLYKGSEISLFEATTMLLYIYGSFPSVSQRAMDELFRLLHLYILPKENILPRSYRDAKKLVEDFLMPVEEVHVCPEEHMAFRGENATLEKCSFCNADRFDPTSSTKKAAKSFLYLPVLPRITRWYRLSEIARRLQIQKTSREYIEDVFDSPSWKKLYLPGGPFNGDKRSLAFAISADGMDPYQKTGTSYSMCPIILRCLNFPIEDRNKFGHMLLTTIIPGPSTPKDLDPYMEPLVDELLQLEKGIPCIDASSGTLDKSFLLKGRVIMGVFDTPGLAKFTKSAYTTAKKNACAHCKIKGVHSPFYRKTLFLQNRRFLSLDSGLRSENCAKYFGGKVEKRRPPKPKNKVKLEKVGRRITECEVLALLHEDFKTPASREAERLRKKYGKKGWENFHRLPYYIEDFVTPVDLMHCVQGVAKKFFMLFTGKSSPGDVIDAEHGHGRFLAFTKEATPWHLNLQQKRLADKRLSSVKVDRNFGWRPKAMFENTPHAKSVEWMKIFCHGIVTYAVHDMLGIDQRTTFAELCQILSDLTDYCVNPEDLESLHTRVSGVLTKVERDFPLGVQTLVTHTLHHVVDYLKRHGPAHVQWMYGFERFNSFVKGRILNRKTPEVTAIESYRMFEFCQTMTTAGLVPKGAITDVSEDEITDDISLPRNVDTKVTLSERDIDELRSLGLDVTASDEVTLTYNDRKIFVESSGPAHYYAPLTYVAVEDKEGDITVGQIVHFLKFSSVGEVAKVVLFQTKNECLGLYTLNMNQVLSNLFLQCTRLSRPLVTAVDQNNPNKVWVLDLKKSNCTKV